MPPNKEAVKEELRNITTVNLIASTSNILEKLLWALIAIFGTWFIYEVVSIQFDFWNENPILTTRQMVKLSDMPLPSMTFCHKGLHKYGPVEQLGNYIDPEKEIPKEVIAIRNEFIKAQYEKIKAELEGTNFCDWLFELKLDRKEDNSILSGKTADQIEILKSDCLVSNGSMMYFSRKTTIFLAELHGFAAAIQCKIWS